MNELLAYILKTALYSGLLSCYYWLFLRNKRLHTFNRFYLLVAIAASLLLPLLHFSLPGMQLPQSAAAYTLLDVAYTGEEEMAAPAKTAASFSWQMALTIGYTLASAAMAFMLIVRFVWLFRLKAKGIQSQQNGYRLVYTDNNKAPFSFFRFLFWKSGVDITSAEGMRILQHELAHIRQRHTLDKLFIQIVLVFFWFNPFYWLLQKELSLVHEFIADETAIEDRDTETFARMLLQEYCGTVYPDIVHPFFYSSTKRRLLMLNQMNKPRFAGMRRMMVLPLLGTAVLLFSFKPNEAPVTRANKTITLALDAGHGGVDDGAVGLNGIKEKDLALKITNRLAQMGEAYNVKVVTLRADDKYIALPDRGTKANEIGADMLVSIHINTMPPAEDANNQPRNPSGFELIVEKRNSQYNQSRALASAIAAQLNDMKLSPRLLDKGLVILRNANMPAVLIECGYMENAADVDRINNSEQLDKLCSHILTGLVAYQNTK